MRDRVPGVGIVRQAEDVEIYRTYVSVCGCLEKKEARDTDLEWSLEPDSPSIVHL